MCYSLYIHTYIIYMRVCVCVMYLPGARLVESSLYDQSAHGLTAKEGEGLAHGVLNGGS